MAHLTPPSRLCPPVLAAGRCVPGWTSGRVGEPTCMLKDHWPASTPPADHSVTESASRLGRRAGLTATRTGEPAMINATGALEVPESAAATLADAGAAG